MDRYISNRQKGGAVEHAVEDWRSGVSSVYGDVGARTASSAGPIRCPFEKGVYTENLSVPHQ